MQNGSVFRSLSPLWPPLPVKRRKALSGRKKKKKKEIVSRFVQISGRRRSLLFVRADKWSPPRPRGSPSQRAAAVPWHQPTLFLHPESKKIADPQSAFGRGRALVCLTRLGVWLCGRTVRQASARRPSVSLSAPTSGDTHLDGSGGSACVSTLHSQH